MSLHAEGKLLHIKGQIVESSNNTTEGDGGVPVTVTERVKKSFERSLQLPAEIDNERVTATLEHGVLTVQLPKKSLAARVKIAIQ